MSQFLLGLELEFHLVDPDGSISNRSAEVISHPKNSGNIMKELSQSMVEVIAPPSHDISTLKNNFKKELLVLDDILEELNLRVIPSSSVGPKSDIVSNDFQRDRGKTKRLILGDYKRDLEHHICGTHIHVDKLSPENIVRQYNIMLAMDPAFSLMSSTPFMLGSNTKKDYRVEFYRNVVFEDHPLQGMLHDYVDSFETVLSRQRSAYDDWKQKIEAKGIPMLGIDEGNCYWGPLKACSRTLESRCADANTLSRLIAFATLYKGAMNLIESSDFQIELTDNSENYFRLRNDVLYLPKFSKLKKFEEIGINQGLSNNELHGYLSNMVTTIDGYLSSSDREYLSEFRNSLNSRTNFSDSIERFARSNGFEDSLGNISEDSAKMVRNYIADVYLEDLKNDNRQN